MVNIIISEQPRFCSPIIDHNGRITSCGLHTLVASTLLIYMVVFGIIRWAYLRNKPKRDNSYFVHDEDEDIDHTRPEYIGYPDSFKSIVNTIHVLVGVLAILNALHIMFIFAEKELVETSIPSYLITSALLRLVAWISNYSFVACERNEGQRWSYFTQGYWYLAFVLSNFELYNRLMYITNPHDDDDQIDWTQSWILMSIYLIQYAIHLILILCAITLTFLWRRSNEANGYNVLNYHSNHYIPVDDDTTTINEDIDIPSADADVESPLLTPKFQNPISMADDPKYAPPKKIGEFLSKSKKLLPFVWPSHDMKLQILILICILLLVAGRIVNVLLPYQNKVLVEGLKSGEFVWKEILFFVGLRFLQGNVGLISTLQNFLWIPVGQFTTREISVKMFEHLLNLSLRFHLNRKTGEILRVQDRGVSSIVSILSSVLFDVIPTLVDIAIAVVYFTYAFDIFFGMIVFMTMSLYLVSTIIMTEWRTKYRRLTNLLDNAMEGKAVDSLLNYETVKLYAAEPFEVKQYSDAIRSYQLADQKSNVTLYILNTTQNVVIQLGLLAGCLLCASRVRRGEMSVGDFIMYLTYIIQLYGPLNWFGNYYRVIQKNFVDMEKMLDLLQELPEVKDLPHAESLNVQKGEVVFDNVSFHYDPRVPTLTNISFAIPSGSTVALVGPSGGGKSTILRLLFRFYDVQSGRILVDGQDIRHVRQRDLRSCIGIVPQQVEEAAEAAQIHDKILGFPEGYDTKVGERGLRLSGGEKQRVAIARTLLKNPQIVLLDEATSALDTHTERHIQKSLRRMTVNRTTLIIAHRLSTIVHADQILVLQGGEIVERGSHLELMHKEGVYHKLWNKQLKHHEKMKREAENKQRLAASASTAAASVATSAGVSNIVNKFKRVEEEGEESSSNMSITEQHNNVITSPNTTLRRGLASFADEGADGDDERQTTTAHESSDDEGEEVEEVDEDQ
ncbi:10888_t:CDS:10 [Funneliformis mosseae]|uniref:10888_t:CDS:1 n=1 Tax=Funneliformis mosseae TaxID=27381 RepID=A0A9N9CF96_FUNMO|nr:10888_t:CDS:10 [Funneliformis mosseae]